MPIFTNLLSLKKLRITEKFIAYLEIINISDYADAINKFYCVTLKV